MYNKGLSILIHCTYSINIVSYTSNNIHSAQYFYIILFDTQLILYQWRCSNIGWTKHLGFIIIESKENNQVTPHSKLISQLETKLTYDENLAGPSDINVKGLVNRPVLILHCVQYNKFSSNYVHAYEFTQSWHALHPQIHQPNPIHRYMIIKVHKSER